MQARRERLKEFDLNETELARLHGPVGIYIGSRTPPEIAVSILAEVTAAKNGVSLPELLQVEGAKAAREVEGGGGWFVGFEGNHGVGFFGGRCGREGARLADPGAHRR